jgi:hypothetical protein
LCVDESDDRVDSSSPLSIVHCCQRLSDEVHIDPLPSQAGDVEQLEHAVRLLICRSSTVAGQASSDIPLDVLS